MNKDFKREFGPPGALIYADKDLSYKSNYVHVDGKIHHATRIDSVQLDSMTKNDDLYFGKLRFQNNNELKIGKNEINQYIPDSIQQLSKINLMYDYRFSKWEKEYIYTQAIIWTLLFGGLEILHGPANKKNRHSYNWTVPVYAFGIAGGLAVVMTFGREKDEIHFKWKKTGY
jgi:hypothetical protein